MNTERETIFVGYCLNAEQIAYAIGKQNVLELRKKYKKIIAKKLHSKHELITFLCYQHYVPRNKLICDNGIYTVNKEIRIYNKKTNNVMLRPIVKKTNILVYYNNHGEIIAITHDFNIGLSNFYAKKEMVLDNKILASIKYFIKIDKKKQKPKENVVSKIRKNSLFGEAYVMFNDYYFATAFIATFYSNNIFIIENNISNTISQMDNKHARTLLLQNPEHPYLNLSWYNSKEKLNNAFIKLKKESEYYLENKNSAYNIYVDGSCIIQKSRYSWAFVVYHNGKEIYFDKGYETQAKYMKHGTQVGEFLAMCRAMKYIVDEKLNNVIIWYDNVQNFNCLEHVKTKSDTFEIYQKYFKYTSKMRQNMIANNLNVDYKHVKAHTGITGNERADKLAKQAIVEVNSIF